MVGSITAGDVLTAAGVDVPAVRAELPKVEPYAVSVRPASALMRRLWMSGIAALAMPWAIYVTPSVFERMTSGAEPHRMGPLMVHELVHIEQYRTLGAVRHIAQYLGDYLRGRRDGLEHWDAYRAVRLEVEARAVARRFSVAARPR